MSLFYVQNPVSGEVKACASKREANALVRYSWRKMKPAEVLAYRKAIAEGIANKLVHRKPH